MAMEVIGTLEFNGLDGILSTFGNIVYVKLVLNCKMSLKLATT